MIGSGDARAHTAQVGLSLTRALGIFLLLVPLSADAATFDVDRTDDTASATACTAAPNDCSVF